MSDLDIGLPNSISVEVVNYTSILPPRHFPYRFQGHAIRKLQVTARNLDWLT